MTPAGRNTAFRASPPAEILFVFNRFRWKKGGPRKAGLGISDAGKAATPPQERGGTMTENAKYSSREIH